jgi:hypothetical protein
MLGRGLLQGLLRAHVGTGQFGLAVQFGLGIDQSSLRIQVVALQVDDGLIGDAGECLSLSSRDRLPAPVLRARYRPAMKL